MSPSSASARSGADPCAPTPRGLGDRWFAAASGEGLADELRAAGLRSVRQLGPRVVAFRGDAARARRVLRSRGLPAEVSPDAVRHEARVPNDPGLARQWYLGAVRAPTGWDVSRGRSDVVVAVIDSGVDSRHPELAGKLLPGYDAAADRPLRTGNTDEVGHGTAIAGLVAAATDNGRGVAAVGWRTRVLPIDAGGKQGLSISAVVAGLYHAADRGADVINLSLGSECRSPVEARAVAYAQSKGALVVASGGNEGREGRPNYPAAYDGVLAVGATTAASTRAPYSNVGSYIDIVAPGGDGDDGDRDGSTDEGDEMTVLAPGGKVTVTAGTSFSAPLVSGAAALVKAANPSLTPQQLAGVLTSSARDLGSRGRDPLFGAGLLDVGAAAARADRS